MLFIPKFSEEDKTRAVGEYKEYRVINMQVSESWIRIIMCARIPDTNTKEVPYPEYNPLSMDNNNSLS